MTDLSTFKGFFSSLSHISQLSFEVWNGKGFLFSSGTDRTKMPGAGEIQSLSAQIMNSQTFQHKFSEGQYAMYGVPIKNGEGIIGSLIAHGPYCEKRRQFLTHLAGILEDKWTAQKEAKEMAEELAHSFEDLYLYSRIAAQIKTLKFSGEMLLDLIENLRETMRVDLAFAELPDRQAYNVMTINPESSSRVPDKKDFVARLLKTISQTGPSLDESYFIVNDSRVTPGYERLHPDPYRFLAVRLQHKEELYGWLGLVSFNVKEIFRRSELRLLSTMAEQIAVVIANTELYHDLQRFVINVVRSLIYAIEAKDIYTRGHSERVNQYCMMMSERLSITEGEKDSLHWASILHDIGKIGIPESVLSKPGRLTADEYSVIKGHPKKGYEILEPIEQLQSSLIGILHHHERYDGRGYPQGLKGDGIPLIGRIIAVADTFDAITSDRPYRTAKTPEEALVIMEEVAGSQLDYDLVELFKEEIIRDAHLVREEKYGKQ